MRISLLGSGSSGNVAYLEAGPNEAPTRLLVDAGLSRAEITTRLGAVALEQIDAVLVTHDHRDHVGCAGSLGRPLYATAGTRRAAGIEAERVLSGQSLRIGAFQVLPVGLPHDADETVGYVFDDGQARVGILTDCGHQTPEVVEGFAGCDLLVLEFNHDSGLLLKGPYPFSLKRRIAGERGHLSNEQAATLLGSLCRVAPPPSLVVAAHLSRVNNRPALAEAALARVLGSSAGIWIATPAGTPAFTVERGAAFMHGRAGGQLAFDFSSRGRYSCQ